MSVTYAATSVRLCSPYRMNGCCRSLLYFGRRLSSFIKLKEERRELIFSWSLPPLNNSPSIYKINKLLGELHILVAGRQTGRITVHHLEQLFEDGPPFGIRKFTDRDLHHRNSQRPDITAHVVALVPLRIDPLWRHIRTTPRVLCLGNRIDQLARNSEITQLDVAPGM